MVLETLKKMFGTHQQQPARPDQVKNNAGGFTFALDPWKRLDRFLILGSDGGSYRASQGDKKPESAESVSACLKLDGPRTVAQIVAISEAGRAPKNNPAIFALAAASSADDEATRKLALAALPRVCRTGTHLFQFAGHVENFRSWGRGLRRAVGDWYNAQPADRLAVQLLKYQQREGWSHRDLLRLSHPTGATPQHNALFRWVTGGGSEAFASATKRANTARAEELPPYVFAFERLHAATELSEVVRLIHDHQFTHEMLPTRWKNHREVWEVLLEAMPQTALLRSLAKMTEVGLLTDGSDAALKASAKIADARRLKQARVHPLAVLTALKVYQQGHGEKGKLRWTPAKVIGDALDVAFYEAFQSVETTGKRYMLALDVSGSMTCGEIAGLPGINPRVGSAAMAMVTYRIEPGAHIMGFSSGLVPVPLHREMRLHEVIKAIDSVPMGGTDCAQPMLHALLNRIEVDVFVIYTDNETWFGNMHPFQALKQYRQAMGIGARLVVVGMTASKFTIADPDDAGMLDIVGFDTAAPAVMADFASTPSTPG